MDLHISTAVIDGSECGFKIDIPLANSYLKGLPIQF